MVSSAITSPVAPRLTAQGKGAWGPRLSVLTAAVTAFRGLDAGPSVLTSPPWGPAGAEHPHPRLTGSHEHMAWRACWLWGGQCPRLWAPVPHACPSSLQAEAAVAAVAVADTVREGSPTVGPDSVSKTWGRSGPCTAALVTPAPGTPAGGSTGPSAAASFFVRYVHPSGPTWAAWTRTQRVALGSWPSRSVGLPGEPWPLLLSEVEGSLWGLPLATSQGTPLTGGQVEASRPKSGMQPREWVRTQSLPLPS